MDVWVVDNASSDGSAELVRREFPAVHLIVNPYNYGFARACNEAIDASESRLVVLLNSDCEITTPDMFEDISRIFDREPRLGVLGPLLLYPNGSIQSAGQEFVSLRKLFREQILFRASPILAKRLNERMSGPGDTLVDVDYVSGACLFARRKVFDKVGMLNESFFMYAEDMEWCRRAAQAHWRVAVAPKHRVIHYKAQSTKQNLIEAVHSGVRNNCQLIRSLQGRRAATIALIYYFTGILLRCVLSFIRKGQSPTEWARLLGRLPGIAVEILFKKQGFFYSHSENPVQKITNC